MKNKEKLSKLFDFFFISMVFAFLFMFTIYENNNNHNETMKEIEEVKELIKQRAVKDTLYWEHLEQCAFESKKERR